MWEPLEEEWLEGGIGQDGDSVAYGDGSGYYQNSRYTRIATWSVVRMSEEGTRCEAHVRGTVNGCHPTVPRGEITAYIEFMRHSLEGAVYYSDCRQVVDAAASGIDARWTSSRCPSADLWKEAKRLAGDHVGPLAVIKVAAHRARRVAEAEGHEALRIWMGNSAADEKAKDLARARAKACERRAAEIMAQDLAMNALRRLAVAAAWAMRRRPGMEKRRVTKRTKINSQPSRSPHELIPRGGNGWECTQCRAYAADGKGRRRLEKKECPGKPPQDIHPSHRLRTTGLVVWCESCGCFSARWPRELRKVCYGQPRSEAQSNVRRRLLAGAAPTTAAYLEDALEVNRRRHSGAALSTSTVRGGRGREGRASSNPPVVGLYLRKPGGPLWKPPKNMPLASGPTVQERRIESTTERTASESVESATSPIATASVAGPPMNVEAMTAGDNLPMAHASDGMGVGGMVASTRRVRRRLTGKQRPIENQTSASDHHAGEVDRQTCATNRPVSARDA